MENLVIAFGFYLLGKTQPLSKLASLLAFVSELPTAPLQPFSVGCCVCASGQHKLPSGLLQFALAVQVGPEAGSL